MEAVLTKVHSNITIDTDGVSPEINSAALSSIQLCLEDGPLLQVKNIRRAHLRWISLQILYCPTGFSSEFILCRDFFDTKLSKFKSMEEYLNRIKQLSDELKSKDIELPRQVIFAWVLNNLFSSYRPLTSSITQSLHNNIEAFTIDSLFSNLLDESKRLEFEDHNEQLMLSAFQENKNKFKAYKECYHLFPDKAPIYWKQAGQSSYNTQQESRQDLNPDNTNVDILYTMMDHEALDLDMNLNNAEVYITTHNTQDSAKDNTDILNINAFGGHNQNDNGSNKNECFILDSAATKHIICDKNLFVHINPVVKHQSEMQGDHYTIFHKNNVVIKSINKDLIASGSKINNLYHIDIEEVVKVNHDHLYNITDHQGDNHSIKPVHQNSISKANKHTSIDLSDLQAKMGHIAAPAITRLINNTTGYDKVTNNNNIDLIN
ncbi:hypothetical protein EPUL_005677, partial [Erysiphe pulchra]